MSLRGQRNSASTTLVSGSTPTAQPSLSLKVVIRTPQADPYGRTAATITLDFQDAAGNPAPVTGFGLAGLTASEGGELFDFKKVSDARYTVQVRFTINTGNWTITIKKNSATLIADENITGPTEDISATMGINIVIPIVKISVPAERPITDRPVPLNFEWVYPDGTPIAVTEFVGGDIETDEGTIANFAGSEAGEQSMSYSEFTAEFTPTDDTIKKVTITVPRQSATVPNTNPPIRGPEQDTTKTFEIAAPPAAATVTGADSVCVLEKGITDNDILNDVIGHLGDDAGGAFTGVLECEAIGDYLYLVVQVRKFTQTVNDDGDLVVPTTPENFLSDAQAGATFLRVNTADCQFEILKAYSDVTLAARSLAVDGNTLYFIEGSHYMYEDGLIFSDPDWREKIGYVRKIEHPSTTIQQVGRNWRSATTTDNPDSTETDHFYGVHGGTASPIRIAEDAIHLITGYGNFDDIGQPIGEHAVNRIGNWNWIQFDNKLNQRLSEIPTNGRTGFDILKDIAIVTNSVLGFKNDTFFMHPREPQKAVNGGGSGITTSQRSLTAEKPNWGEFPSQGWLYIDEELIKHSGADENGQFANLVRGVEGTTAAAHTGSFDIYFVDHVLSLTPDTLEMPIKNVVATNDNRQFHNRVKIRFEDGEELQPIEDATSIAENGPSKLLELNLPLDSHQRVWAEWLAQVYLAEFKDIKQALDLNLKHTPDFFPGDVVYLKIPERMHLNGTLCQVLVARESFRQPPSTAVKLVTL
ncbi:MAG: hypothetical protein OXL96_13755 [Candidatus Poribacteria bacterium]|nr:hypothetical protein [Candidatus Poribacteria bacterium]